MPTSALKAAAFFLLVAPALHAQQSKNEFALEIGGTFTPARPVANDRPLTFDPALELGLEFDHSFFQTPLGHIDGGLDFAASPFDVKTSGGPATAVSQYAYLFLTPHVRFKFRPLAHVEPWLSAGIGYANYKEGDFRNGAGNPRTGTTGPQGEFSGGVDLATPVRIKLPVGLRLGVRDYLAAPPSYNAPVPRSQNNILVFGGIVLKF